MRELVLLVCIAGFAGMTHSAAAQDFEGMTVVDLHDPGAGRAIVGHAAGTQDTLVTFVSPQGSYAAVGSRSQRSGDRVCIAWATVRDGDAGSITFGLPPDEQTRKLIYPPVCQPFTMTLTAPNRVRIQAHNKFADYPSPVYESSTEASFDGELDVVARVPLVEMDWARPVFSKYMIRQVRLGPVDVVRAGLPADARFTIGHLQGTIKKLFAEYAEPDDGKDSTAFNGYVAPAERVGATTDILYAGGSTKRLSQSILTDVFEKAAIDRYGAPSIHRSTPTQVELIWLFDLSGKQIFEGGAAPDNCLATKEQWLFDSGNTIGVNVADGGDVRDFGCSLSLSLSHDGDRGTIGLYHFKIESGYVAGLNQFMHRLDELAGLRKKIGAAKSFRPKL